MSHKSNEKNEFYYRQKLAIRISKEWEDWKKESLGKVKDDALNEIQVDFMFFSGGILQSFAAIFCGDENCYLKSNNFENVPATEFMCRILLSSKESVIMRLYVTYMKSDLSVRAPLREVIQTTVNEYFEAEKNNSKNRVTQQ